MIPRTEQKEILDGEGVPPEMVLAAYHALLRYYIRKHIRGGAANSVLDVGAGNGAFCISLWDWAKKHNILLQITALEPNALLAAEIEKQKGQRDIVVRRGYLEEVSSKYDVVVTSQVLHHIEPQSLQAFVGLLYEHSLRAVIISDLIRSRFYYYFTKVILKIITRDPISRHDGPISILRAYSKTELERVFNILRISNVVFRNFFPRRIVILKK
jgi:2-polyprenyl-3-methyl-5-hydroxy-6-metoxy-1,4-benzoquinol methylase